MALSADGNIAVVGGFAEDGGVALVFTGAGAGGCVLPENDTTLSFSKKTVKRLLSSRRLPWTLLK